MPKVRRHAAIMFTDIVGYTSLMGSDEERALELLNENRNIHTKLIEQFNGTLIKEMGDGMLISFDLASQAVRCAIEIQKASKAHDIPLKIGIHEGEMVFEGNDVLGDGVNIASRIQDDTASGCISISGSVYHDIRNKANIQAQFIEEKQFKNVHEKIKVYRVLCGDEVDQKSVRRSPSITQQKKSIIVLPFVNMSPDPEQEYFCDGLTEEIITDLSYVHNLLVISRSSAMTFKGSKQSMKEIASKVNVQYVLEGSVRKSENNLRIIAQLIDAENDSHIWAEKYSQRLENIFNIQENVSRSIVDALKLKLTSEEEKNLVKHPIPAIDANDFYLKARYEIMRFTDESLSRALVLLQSALDIAGANARLYAEIGFAHMQYVNLGIKPEEHMGLAMEYANKALKLDPESSWANINKAGHAILEEGDIKKAIAFMKIALANNPNDPDLLLWGIWIYMPIGKFEVIYPMIDLAMKVDPLNPWHYMSKGGADFFSGQFISAVENCSQAFSMQPENPMITFWYAISLAYVKRYKEAISIVEKLMKNPDRDVMSQQCHFLKLTLTSDLAGISQLSSEDFFSKCRNDLQHSYHNACFYAFLDNKESAFEWLENATNRGFINYPFMSEMDPFLENIRSEPRFKKLMQRVKKEWEAFEV